MNFKDFSDKYGIDLFCEVPYDITDAYVLMPESEDFFKVYFNWKSNRNSSNKCVSAEGQTFSSEGYASVKFVFPNMKARKMFKAGIQDTVDGSWEHNKWEYVGFTNIKYGVEMVYIRRDTNYITYQWEEEDVPSN